MGKKNLTCKIKNIELENVTHIKFLGITLDSKGLYEEHIEKIKNRCIPIISFLHKLKHCFNTNEKTLIIFYKSLIRSILEYGHVLLLNLTETRKNKIEVIQNKALRTILGCDYLTSNKNIRQHFKIEKMSDRHKKLSKKWYDKALTIRHHPMNNHNFEFFDFFNFNVYI